MGTAPDKVSTLAPVAVFAYNRADKIIRCLRALAENPEAKDTRVVVFSDGPKSEAGRAAVEETRHGLDAYAPAAPFKSFEIVKAPANKGLAASILEGVTRILKESESVIVLEDDLVVSSGFLDYMNRALAFYADEPRVGAVSAYTYPLASLAGHPEDVYLLRKGDCWGWATWRDRWQEGAWAEMDYAAYLRDRALRRQFEAVENGWDTTMVRHIQGHVNSWAIRWMLHLFRQGLLTVYPKRSLVSNDGFDGSGTHSNREDEQLFAAAAAGQDAPCSFSMQEEDARLAREAAVYPRKGGRAGLIYFLKRLYVRGYDLKTAIGGI